MIEWTLGGERPLGETPPSLPSSGPPSGFPYGGQGRLGWSALGLAGLVGADVHVPLAFDADLLLAHLAAALGIQDRLLARRYVLVDADLTLLDGSLLSAKSLLAALHCVYTLGVG
jgi:hypothetical protein